MTSLTLVKMIRETSPTRTARLVPLPRDGGPPHRRARSGARRESPVRSPAVSPENKGAAPFRKRLLNDHKDDGKVLVITLRSPPTPWSYRRRMLGRSRASRRGGPNGHAPRPLQKSKGPTRPYDAVSARRVAWRGTATWGQYRTIPRTHGRGYGQIPRGDLAICRFVARAIRGRPQRARAVRLPLEAAAPNRVGQSSEPS